MLTSFVTLFSILFAFKVQAFQVNGVVTMTRPIADLRSPRNKPKALSVSLGTAAVENERSNVLDWSFLDGVYLITCPNADPSGSRIKKAKQILGSVGLLDKVQVKEFETDDEDRIRGCYSSHISTMKEIFSKASKRPNDKPKSPFDDFFGVFKGNDLLAPSDLASDNVNVLILEDNLALSRQLKQSSIDAIAKYGQENPDWDMIHLSYIPYVPDLKISKTTDKDIVKLSSGIGSALGTTAYIINSKAMRTIIADDEENGGFYAPIPDVMAKLFPETRFAADPTIFVRAPDTESLVNPQLDDLRSILFRPSVAAFVQGLLVVTGLKTNDLLPITIVLLLLTSAASAVVTFDSIWNVWTTGSLDGPIFLPLFSASFSIFSLAVLAQGAMLAPKQKD